MIDTITNYKTLILRVLGVILVLILVNLCINYSFTRISVKSSDKTVGLFTVVDSPLFKKDLYSNKTSLVIIKRGTKLLTVRSPEKESRLPFKFRPLYSGTYSINLNPQMKVNKVASNALSCGIMNPSEQYNSYRCQGGSDIVRYKTGNQFPENTVVLDRLQTQLVKPQQYLGGILAFTYINPESNAFKLSEISVKDTLTESSTSIEQIIKAPSIDRTSLITDKTDKKNKTFLAVNNDSNKLFIFDSTSDKKPVQVNLLDGIDKDKIATHDCALSLKTVTCIYSRFGYKDDEDPERDVLGSLDTVVTIYDTSGKKLIRRTIKEAGDINQIQFKQHYIALRTDQNYLVIYSVIDSKFKRVGETAGVEDAIFTEKGGLLVKEGNSLYSLSPDNLEAHLIIRSKNLRFSRFSSSYENGYFAGFINNQKDANLSAYEVTADELTGERVVDILPSSYSKLIRETDYDQDILYIKLALKSFTSDQQTGATSVDQSELDSAKKEVLDQITKSGVTKHFKKIVFSY